jgi:hypothetical protein
MSKKKNLPDREERAEIRADLAEFYTYEPWKGRHPMSLYDMQIIERLSDVLERTNGIAKLRELVDSWKVGAKDEELVQKFDEFLAELPASEAEAIDSGYISGGQAGLFEQLKSLLAEPQKSKVPFLEIQGDIFNIEGIKRMNKGAGYDTTLSIPTYLILINKNVFQGDHLSSTFTYSYYSETDRDTEWGRLKKALIDFSNVEFIS